ncbi:MAG: hypothetical protein BZY79_06425 [SAR202 cluster bacterium Casp-Chloro-G4]|nr:universal stress protein [Chloroflexota bacterium]MDA1228756.1 universal stress protein [Chloroflexota bacterium]PKB60924.1 MAG: hypothetical protein BZY79_06425 [SAR202 cluster bacterium Casp-Chloro-G4]
MYTQILVPLDGSSLAERAIPHAQGLAKTYGATVHLLQVITHNPSGGHAQGDSAEPREGVYRAALAGLAGGASTGNSFTLDLVRRLKEAQIEEAQEYLAHVASQLKVEGIAVETQLFEGSPHEQIAEYAKQNGVDVIVMSTHGHGGVKRLIVGSTTDRVIRSGDIPVLVVT